MKPLSSSRLRPLTFAAVGLVAGAAFLATRARAVETNVEVRDPSTIIARNGEYWIYGTGLGTQQFSSRDKLNWTKRGPALPTSPAWVAQHVAGNKDNSVWAPDVRFFGGKYYLYYSYSAWGTHNSGIGVASNSTLDPSTWHEDGMVVYSDDKAGFNAIDPCVFEGEDGKMYLSFGSYSDGIHMAELNPQTGLFASAPPYKRVATRPSVPGNAIEASYFYFHDGYYYGFVNFDGCCNGAKSSYNIRVARSKNVFGPYLDKDGKDLNDGGGSLFWAATFDNGSGRPVDDQVGPGHVGILKEGNDFWLTTHMEWARDKKGATTVNLNRLAWDKDGWPSVVLDNQGFKLTSGLATHDVATVVGDAVQTDVFDGRAGQKWNLQWMGDGFYRVHDASSNKVLTVSGEVKPGAAISATPFADLPTQKWRVLQNEDGTYALRPAANLDVSLDVRGAGVEDGTPLQVWSNHTLDPEKWSFRAR